ncbi:MAG TPA: hypothetical protein VGL23_14050 [Chloroflexota bacterium]
MLVLIAVGGGIVEALALARALGAAGSTALGPPRRWVAATVLVTAVALVGSYALIRALDAVGVLPYCGPETPWSPEC